MWLIVKRFKKNKLILIIKLVWRVHSIGGELSKTYKRYIEEIRKKL